jgi:tetratricopeptide (TPR) repeat protein
LPVLDSGSSAPAVILVAKQQRWLNEHQGSALPLMKETFESTLAWYGYALERSPRSASLWYARGAFLMNFGKLRGDDGWIRKEAGRSFTQALKVSPGDANSAVALANMGLDVKAYGPVLLLLDATIKSSWNLRERHKLQELYDKVKLLDSKAAGT